MFLFLAPDMLGGDGIYSGYFSSFTSRVEHYSITVKVTNEPGRSRVITEFKQGTSVPPCCGSQMTLLSGEPIGEFSLHRLLGSYQVTSVKPSDFMPPSQVMDLKAKVETADRLVLSWSAPGGDYNKGKGKD